MRFYPKPQEERENWLPVPGWPAYEVSDLGRVRSVPRVVRCRNGTPHTVRARIRKTGGSEYPQVCLSNTSQGEVAVARVHTLVLTAFVGPCPLGMECRHLDDVKTNNRLSNLRWGTRSENHGEDRRRNGILTIGTRHGNARLNDQSSAGNSVRLAGCAVRPTGVGISPIWRQRRHGCRHTDGKRMGPRSVDQQAILDRRSILRKE